MTSDGDARNRLPETGAGFVWDLFEHENGSVLVLRPNVEGLVASFTTRVGGISAPPYDELNVSFAVSDDAEHVRVNRAIAGATVGGDGAWSVVRQVHGPGVVRAVAPGRLHDADAQWTEESDRTLAVLGADCVLLAVVGEGRMGVVHAGWRGLAAGVVEHAVRAVSRRPRVFAGPAIGPCCFEVGDDVAAELAGRFGSSVFHGRRRVDLWAAAEQSARDAGANDVWAARICTSCHPALYFSHRRDGGRTGRQALLARLGTG